MNIKPLSNIDITKTLHKHNIKVRFIPYEHLRNIGSIETIMPCIILYQLHNNFGHWCCLFRNHEGINYFDPTGRVPDALLKTHFKNTNGRKRMGADYTYLNRLLYNTGEDIVYNDDKLQSDTSKNKRGNRQKIFFFVWIKQKMVFHHLK